MGKTIKQRLARRRQHETGEKYTTALRFVEANFDSLLDEYHESRRSARTRPCDAPGHSQSGHLTDAEAGRVERLSVMPKDPVDASTPTADWPAQA
ncbi:hypothetical protein G6553_01570 [Nocardioides sp. IC4_145]|uniref:hypothetical protein n=1 Tax=Nocardioides sp. IC4_145 TaxID=2714037 RepID=UPI00140ADD49|nr:hypothetical protein [Nocardioides sp. IC4_145]NHC21863.1 hypothetical protein [Nocardioides sp. IC4_145]